MKLIADLCSDTSVPGKRSILLTDEHGVMLPNQRPAPLTQRVGEVSTITIEFVIDGDRVKLGAK